MRFIVNTEKYDNNYYVIPSAMNTIKLNNIVYHAIKIHFYILSWCLMCIYYIHYRDNRKNVLSFMINLWHNLNQNGLRIVLIVIIMITINE